MPPRTLRSACRGVTNAAAISSTLSRTSSVALQLPLLPFLYPSQIRHYGAGTQSKPQVPESEWAFLLGTHEADKLPPPPMNRPYRPQGSSGSSAQPGQHVGSHPLTPSPYQRAAAQPSTGTYGNDATRFTARSSSIAGVLNPRETTISEREREIFQSIFENILSARPTAGQIGGSKHRIAAQPSPTLTALFESAVGPQFSRQMLSFGPMAGRSQTELAMAMESISGIADYPPSLRAAAAHAAGLSKVPLTQAEQMEEAKRQQELATRIRDMQACDTDLELIAYLNEHVFTMVNVNAPQSDQLEIKGKQYTFPSASYADLLSEGMRLLYKTFRDLTGTLAVFERIKSLGAESYVVGCSVSVYNHVLEVQWEGYQDIHKIEATLAEMRVNGVEGDLRTTEILRTVVNDSLLMAEYNWPAVHQSEQERDAVKRVNYAVEDIKRAIDTKRVQLAMSRRSGTAPISLL